MNKRERREQYLATRRPPEYLEKRREMQEASKQWDAFFEKYPGFYQRPMKERYAIAVQEGLIDPTDPKHSPEKFGIEL
jgi:hypothetical protein